MVHRVTVFFLKITMTCMSFKQGELDMFAEAKNLHACIPVCVGDWDCATSHMFFDLGKPASGGILNVSHGFNKHPTGLLHTPRP